GIGGDEVRPRGIAALSRAGGPARDSRGEGARAHDPASVRGGRRAGPALLPAAARPARPRAAGGADRGSGAVDGDEPRPRGGGGGGGDPGEGRDGHLRRETLGGPTVVVFGNILIGFARVLRMFLRLYFRLLIGRALVSWAHAHPRNGIVRFLIMATDPPLWVIRRLLPRSLRYFPLDIAFLVLLGIVIFAQYALVQSLLEMGV